MATIADNFDNVLAFLQAVAIKSPQVTAAPLSIHAEKRARVCLCCWIDTNLTTLPNLYPQDHMDLTGVFTNVSTRLQIAEALHPVAAAHRKAEKQTKGWDRLAPTAQCVILAASATNVTSILTSPPPTLHRFIKVRNATALQAD